MYNSLVATAHGDYVVVQQAVVVFGLVARRGDWLGPGGGLVSMKSLARKFESLDEVRNSFPGKTIVVEDGSEE